MRLVWLTSTNRKRQMHSRLMIARKPVKDDEVLLLFEAHFHKRTAVLHRPHRTRNMPASAVHLNTTQGRPKRARAQFCPASQSGTVFRSNSAMGWYCAKLANFSNLGS